MSIHSMYGSLVLRQRKQEILEMFKHEKIKWSCEMEFYVGRFLPLLLRDAYITSWQVQPEPRKKAEDMRVETACLLF